MPKKKRTAPKLKKEEVLIEDEPVEDEPVNEDDALLAEEPEFLPAPPEEYIPEEEVVAPVAPLEDRKCTKCGLLVKDMAQVYNGLSIDLKQDNRREKCPGCWAPVEPY